MQDLQWDHVKEWFNPHENGAVPDLVVAGTSLADWEALLALIRSEGWRSEYEFGDHPADLPSSAAKLFDSGPEGWLRSLRVWPDPNIEIIFRPWNVDEIVGDVSLFDLHGQERLDLFCGILRLLGRALDKRVAVYAEGGSDYPPILAYEVDQDHVVFFAGPWAR
jgi:hypothetical protein